MLAGGGGAIIVGKALFGFCATGSLSWPASSNAARLVVGAACHA